MSQEDKGDDRTKYYTIQELAELWQCSTDIIYSLLTRRVLKGFKIGRVWRIPDSARAEYEATPPPPMTPIPRKTHDTLIKVT